MLKTLFVDLTDLRLWLIVLAVSTIGVADKLVYYYAGQRGGQDALNKIHGFTPERAQKLHNLYDRWGSILLLLASVPVIGSAMTVLGGVGGVSRNLFIVLVSISNLVRNWLIVILSGGIVALLS
jgi:membrane protein DedA with SNARE-associated domain